MNLSIPVVADTAHGLMGGNDSLGLEIYVKADGYRYFRDTTAGGHKWTKEAKFSDIGAGGVSSFNTNSLSGFATVSLNSNTGAVVQTFSFNNVSPHSYWGNNTGSTGPPGYFNIGVADLPTGIPNANLSNSSIGFTIGSLGSSPNWSASPVSLGGTATLNLPTSSASINGILNSTDWNTFNGKQQAIQWQSQGVNTGALGGAATVNFTGSGVSASLSGGVLTVTIPGGGGGSGISSLNGLTTGTQVFATGTSGSDFNIVSAGSTHTFNFPNASVSNRGLLTPTDYLTFSNKIGPGDTATMLTPYLRGAGSLSPLFTTSVASHILSFALTNASANTVFGNSTASPAAPTYFTPSLTSTLFSNEGTTTTVLIGNAAGNLSFGSVNLTSMTTGTLAATRGGTGLTSYTTGDLLIASSATTLASLPDVAVNNVLISGGVGSLPAYGKVALGAMANFAASSLMGNPTGSPAAPSAITLGYGLKFVGTTLAFDSANVKDTIFAVEGLTAYGATGDSIGLGGFFYQNASVSLRNLYAFQIDSAQAGSGKGFRVNFATGSDAGYDMFYRDSATGYWTRLAKGTPGQVLGMSLSGGLAWVNQSGGGGSGSLTVQRVTSGTSGTVTGGNYIYVIDPSSTITTYATTLPASPSDGQVVVMVFGGTLTSGTIVTNLTVLPNGSQHLIDNTPPGSATADNSLKYYYVNANTTWYRFKP